MTTRLVLQKILKEEEDKHSHENMGKNKSHQMSRKANEE
jgi:hypothetical protein